MSGPNTGHQEKRWAQRVTLPENTPVAREKGIVGWVCVGYSTMCGMRYIKQNIREIHNQFDDMVKVIQREMGDGRNPFSTNTLLGWKQFKPTREHFKEWFPPI